MAGCGISTVDSLSSASREQVELLVMVTAFELGLC